jgi:hypothetical protein
MRREQRASSEGAFIFQPAIRISHRMVGYRLIERERNQRMRWARSEIRTKGSRTGYFSSEYSGFPAGLMRETWGAISGDKLLDL